MSTHIEDTEVKKEVTFEVSTYSNFNGYNADVRFLCGDLLLHIEDESEARCKERALEYIEKLNEYV